MCSPIPHQPPSVNFSLLRKCIIVMLGDRGRDGWMASSTQWTWVWANSGRWWKTKKPGVMRFMGSPRVGHDLATEQRQQFPQCLGDWVKWMRQYTLRRDASATPQRPPPIPPRVRHNFCSHSQVELLNVHSRVHGPVPERLLGTRPSARYSALRGAQIKLRPQEVHSCGQRQQDL